jgi:hypothetical protein
MTQKTMNRTRIQMKVQHDLFERLEHGEKVVLREVYGVRYAKRPLEKFGVTLIPTCKICGKALTNEDFQQKRVIEFNTRLPQTYYMHKATYFACASHFREGSS